MLPTQTEVSCNKPEPVPTNVLRVCSPLTFPFVDHCISGYYVLLHFVLDGFHLLHKTLTRALDITEPTHKPPLPPCPNSQERAFFRQVRHEQRFCRSISTDQRHLGISVFPRRSP